MKLSIFVPSRSLSPLSLVGRLGGSVLVVSVVFPLCVLVSSSSWGGLIEALNDPRFLQALALSLRTTLVSVALVTILGTPLAWWLASTPGRLSGAVSVLLELPIMIPPAVIGVALLMTFGRTGVLGAWLSTKGIFIAFTPTAVVLSQVTVSAPYFVQAAANAFREVTPDTVVVARSLGATSSTAFLRVALPIALPGVIVGASLAWARALGEFGATLLFAGNLPGHTQTMPLAIFYALESDVRMAVVLATLLVAFGAVLLLSLRLIPSLAASVGPRNRDFR